MAIISHFRMVSLPIKVQFITLTKIIITSKPAMKPQAVSEMIGSILEIAFHAAGDKHTLVNTAFGDGRLTWDELKQRFERDGGDIGAVLRLADAGYDLLVSTLASLEDEALSKKVSYYHGKRMPAEEIFLLALEHDIYHAGQIWYVRGLVERLKEGGQ